MSFELSPQARSRLEQLARGYRAAMPAKLESLEQDLQTYFDTASESARDEVRRRVHQLRGSARLYECESLFIAADACETALDQARTAEEVRSAVQPVLAAMQALIPSKLPPST